MQDKLRRVLAARCSKCKGSQGNKQQQSQPQQAHQQQVAAEGGGASSRPRQEPQQPGGTTGRASDGISSGTRKQNGRGKTAINQRAPREDEDVVMLGSTLGAGSAEEATMQEKSGVADSRADIDSVDPAELLSEELHPWPVQTGQAKKRVRADQQPHEGLSQENEPEPGRRKSPQMQEERRVGASSAPEATLRAEPVKPLGPSASRGNRASWGADLGEDLGRGVHVRPRQEGRRAFSPDGDVFGSSPGSPFEPELPPGGGPVTPSLEASSLPGTIASDMVLGRSSLSSLGRGGPSKWGTLGGGLETGTVASVRMKSRSTAHLAVEQAMKQAQRRKEGTAAQAPLNPFTLLPRAQAGAAREPTLGASGGEPTSSSRGTLHRDSFDSENDPFDLLTSDWSQDEFAQELPTRGIPGQGNFRHGTSTSLNLRTGSGGIGSAGVSHAPEGSAKAMRTSGSCNPALRGTGQASTKVSEPALVLSESMSWHAWKPSMGVSHK